MNEMVEALKDSLLFALVRARRLLSLSGFLRQDRVQFHFCHSWSALHYGEESNKFKEQLCR